MEPSSSDPGHFLIPDGYAEHAPPTDLASRVECFWTRVGHAHGSLDAGQELRVLPDGCVDIVLAFERDGAGNAALSDALVVGTMTRPLVLRADRRLHAGARFRPGYAFAAFSVPAAELTDQRVSYDLMATDAGDRVEAIERSGRDLGLDLLVKLVRRRLSRAAGPPPCVGEAVRRISLAGGNTRVVAVASDIGVSRQQLARQFAVHVGVSPKTFARVMRMRAVLARADAARAAHPRNLDWSAVANDLGYFDQPHLIDDFKTLAGMTPGEWAERARGEPAPSSSSRS